MNNHHAADGSEVLEVAIDCVDCETQVRKIFREAPLAGLEQSVKELGILQPILVRRVGNRFVVIDGERRLRAARSAGLKSVRVLVARTELDKAQIIQHQLITNCQREGLSAIEKAKAIECLMAETGWTAAEVASKLGMSPAQVSKLTALLLLSEEIQEQVACGRLAPSTAYEIAKLPDSEHRARLAAEAVEGGLTREHVAGKARKPAGGDKPRAPRRQCRFVVPMGDGRSLTLSGVAWTPDVLLTSMQEFLGRLQRVCKPGLEMGEALNLLAERSP